MERRHRHFLTAILGLLAVTQAFGQTIDERIATITAQFQETYDRDVAKPYETALADLDGKYAAAIERALNAATSDGQLDDALALKDEKKRLDEKAPLPPIELANLPDSLKNLRSTYRTELAKLTASRNDAAQPLYDHYDKLLGEIQDELTQKKKIDEALAVRTKREEIAKQRSGMMTLPDEASSAATATTEASLPSDPALHREMAQWALENGGEVEVSDSAGERKIRDMAGLPSEPFQLTGIEMGSTGGKRVTGKELKKIAQLTSLTRIDLGDGPSDGTLEFLKDLIHLRFVMMMPKELFDEKQMVHLSKLTALENINLQITNGTGEGTVHLTGATRLKNLQLGLSGNLTQKGAEAIAQLKTIQNLHLVGWVNDKNTDTLIPIATLPELIELDLTYCTITPEGFAHISALPKLEKLNFHGAKPDNRGFAFLGPCADTLTNIFLHAATSNDEGIRHIVATLPNLTDLTVSQLRSTCTSASLAELAKLPKLKYLGWHLTERMKKEDWAVVSQFPAVEKLNLSESSITDASLPALATIKPLQQLTLTKTPVTDAGVAEFQKLRSDVKITR